VQGHKQRFGKGLGHVLTDERLSRILTLVQIAVGVAEFCRIIIVLSQALGIL
jgi:hypothetical protein